MNILKFALLGAAVAYGIDYITKKREDGSSVLDDIKREAPNWINDAKQFATQSVNDIKQNFDRR